MYRFALAVLVCAAALPSPSRAQSYPSKPIHFILPYVPGGIIDTAGRHLALRLSENWGNRSCPRIVRAPAGWWAPTWRRARRRTATRSC